MHATRSINLQREALVHHSGVSRALALIVTIGLALVIIVGVAFGVAVRADSAPNFDQPIRLGDQHRLVIHYGPSTTCAFIPNPPQHDCFMPGPQRREFSVEYLTPQGARSLIWLQLPPR